MGKPKTVWAMTFRRLPIEIALATLLKAQTDGATHVVMTVSRLRNA